VIIHWRKIFQEQKESKIKQVWEFFIFIFSVFIEGGTSAMAHWPVQVWFTYFSQM